MDISLLKKKVLSKDNLIIIFLKLLLFVIVFYNFHRYLFKYGSVDFVDVTIEGGLYSPSPLIWQLGKYIVVLFIMVTIYLLTRYQKGFNINGFVFYLFITFFFVINLFSGLYYKRTVNSSLGIIQYQLLNFDELEYIIFSFLLFPLLFIENHILIIIKEHIDSILKFVTVILIVSNILVIGNYFLFDVLPFHGYRGSLLIRFGGFWDDPNCFSIFCCFLIFYSIHKGRLFSSIGLFMNIIFAISFTGYVLFFFIIFYFMLRNKKALLLGVILMLAIVVIALMNIDLITSIYVLKQGSLDSHANNLFDFIVIPLQQPLIFHETWLLSMNINYPPISYIATFILLRFFINTYFRDSFTIQKSFFIIFFISSAFLPFVYMFPLNFVAIFFFILYCKKIIF